MSKRPFKAQASSSRADPNTSLGGFGTVFAGSALSYLSELPNLSSITDANVVVAFKNLLKKDSTTKGKGLEDFRSFVQAHPYEQDGGVEQPILEAWVKLYPRLSVDNSRRVRELSHNLQYELLKSARKRMERHIPDVIGAWLAGTYDRDRQVARAASDGITSFLDSEAKILSLWRRCQPQILSYAQESFKETPQTLSDERTVNADDVQAKYDRVIGASLSLVVHLLVKLDGNETQKCQESYEVFLSKNKHLWGIASSKDAFLRRILAQLLSVCLDKQSDIIEHDLEIISHYFISEGLRNSQNGSSLLFVEALNKLTNSFPQVWSAAYKGKKQPSERLRQFLEKGSQGGPPQYWQVLSSLLGSLPKNVLPSDLDGAESLLKAQRAGISSREEPRTNAPTAWSSYFEVVKCLKNGLSDRTDSEQLLRTAVFPVFEQFIRPAPQNSSWSMGGSTTALARAFHICFISQGVNIYPKTFQEEWQRLADSLITTMLTSLPEQSKDYAKSQAAVAAHSNRWFGLQAEIIKSAKSPKSLVPIDSLIIFLASPCSTVVLKAMETISIRNGKPYGAAAMLETALRITPELVSAVPPTEEAVASFLQTEVPKFITSPSSEYLIASIYAFGNLSGQGKQFEEIWRSTIDALFLNPESSTRITTVQGLISSHAVSKMAQRDIDLQTVLFQYASGLILGQLNEWTIFESSVTFDALGSETATRVVSTIVDHLDRESNVADGALHALEIIAKRRPQLLQIGDAAYLTVLTRLLALTEVADPATTSRASTLKTLIERGGIVATNSDQIPSPILDIIKENLESAGPQSLSVDTLVNQAETFNLLAGDKISSKVLPSSELWFTALFPHLKEKPNVGLSLISTLGAATSIIQPAVLKEQIQQLARDVYGYTIPFRMALYTSKLFSVGKQFQDLQTENEAELLRLLSLTMTLVGDQQGLGEKNNLWSSSMNPDVDAQVQEFLELGQRVLNVQLSGASSWRDLTVDDTSVSQKLVLRLIETSKGISPLAFYSARSLSTTLSTLAEAHGWKSAGGDEWLSSLDILKTSTPDVLTAVAILSGLQDFLGSSGLVNTLCNRLVSDITGASAVGERTLNMLLLLNATLAVYEPGNLPVAQNRVVFAVKQITSWMESGQTLPLPVVAEACRCLQFLLPSIKDVYGPYWETIIGFCVTKWKSKDSRRSSDDRLPVLNASLRLCMLLKCLQDPNDDLTESLTDSARSISDGLIELLRLPRFTENQPWRIFDEALCRQVMEIPTIHIQDLSSVYPLVASDYHFVQLAAFQVLKRAVPAAQEQISLNVILEKTDARLPEELLSLLLDAPLHENFTDEDLASFPSTIRGYLFSWQLVFASYPNASFKVRNDYSEILKSENYITPLFDFLFDALGHSAGKPLNLDRAGFTPHQIQSYNVQQAEAEPNERSMQWILINLYFLCLKYAPGLAKNWWMNCKSKQTRIAAESWTEKHFSPLVIGDTLDDVAKWAEQQEPGSEDDKELIVKISKKSREVYAGCEVDDMQMQIVIRLPAAYPLEGVKVDGINRVAVSEKKWQSWLMITQGVITFSNGSIIDGLTTFRKNITGALKGQTECAICYSIISSDKKMPDKRCQTCKNLFHSSCLFKWFASSNQSTCPLCRNPFNYGTDAASRARRRGGPD